MNKSNRDVYVVSANGFVLSSAPIAVFNTLNGAKLQIEILRKMGVIGQISVVPLVGRI